MDPDAPSASSAPSGAPPLPGGRAALLAAARAELVEHGHGAISLRAVARRAGVSHAAPKYHFADRAGLLTAVATEGFLALAAALRGADGVGPGGTSGSSAVPETPPGQRLAALGRAYIDFGLASPALFDLMFRPSELHPGDPQLQAAQHEAIGILASSVVRIAPAAEDPSPEVPPLALISWALVHGLVVLTRDGALQTANRFPDPQAAADLARALTDVFTSQITQTSRSSAAPAR